MWLKIICQETLVCFRMFAKATILRPKKNAALLHEVQQESGSAFDNLLRLLRKKDQLKNENKLLKADRAELNEHLVSKQKTDKCSVFLN